MNFLDGHLFPENQDPMVITAAPYGPEWVPSDFPQDIPVTMAEQVQKASIKNLKTRHNQRVYLVTKMSMTTNSGRIARVATIHRASKRRIQILLPLTIT